MTITAKDLCQALSAARADELKAMGIADPTSVGTRYYPKGWFDYDVEVVGPNEAKQPRSPRYCCNQSAAGSLAQLLGASEIKLGNAVNFTGLLDSWNDTKLVPYLIFGSGDTKSKPINAGLVLDMFNGASNPATEMEANLAILNALFEIKGAF